MVKLGKENRRGVFRAGCRLPVVAYQKALWTELALCDQCPHSRVVARQGAGKGYKFNDQQSAMIVQTQNGFVSHFARQANRKTVSTVANIIAFH